MSILAYLKCIYHFQPIILQNEDSIIDGVFYDIFNASPKLVIIQAMQIAMETGKEGVLSVQMV